MLSLQSATAIDKATGSGACLSLGRNSRSVSKEAGCRPGFCSFTSVSRGTIHYIMSTGRFDIQLATSTSRFDDPGQCVVPQCEVALVLDDQSRLYVCKHAVANLSEYFGSLLLGDYKEGTQTEVRIHEVSRDDMKLFLEYSVPLNVSPFRPNQRLVHLPLTVDHLCTLISLADRFLYPHLCHEIAMILQPNSAFVPPQGDVKSLCKLISLGDRLDHSFLCRAIVDRFIGPIFKDRFKPDSEKFDLVEAADKYKGHSTLILEACIRLCANLPCSQVAALQGRVSNGTLLAIYDIIGKTTPKLSDAPKHKCDPEKRNKKRHMRVESGKYNRIEITSDRDWRWHCTKCGDEQEATMSYEEIKKIEIDKRLIGARESLN